MDFDYLKMHYQNHFGVIDEIECSYCPYRICPLGAHVDHQLGFVTGFAINYGIGIAYGINDDGLCQVVSHNFKIRKRFNTKDILEKKNDWADYIRGAVKILQNNHYPLDKGINAYIYGELPIGGLSSSAAIIIAFLKAISKANNFKLTNEELIDYAYKAETEFVGMSIGKLDQSVEVLAKRNKLLVLDTLTGDYKTIDRAPSDIKYKFIVIHSGAERQLASSAYNIRVDECKAAAFIVNSQQNVYKKFKDTFLRDVPYEDFLKYKNTMPTNFQKRAMHYYQECERVKKGEEAWLNGDVLEFGRLISESGKSSIELYEAGSQVLKDLYNIIFNIDGVFGTRFMGGGFNGACLALIDANKTDYIVDKIKNEYLKIHPEYSNMQIFICETENGAGE